MNRKLFIRNVGAREQLDIFLVSGVSSLLLLRYYLYLTGYPQVGGSVLHVSHMLWGGLLMTIALVLVFSFLGRRMQRLTALIGGAGFGIFIDEIGKFITKDNDYFFRPTIGIIYALFVLLYLLASYVTRQVRLTSREYQLNALSGLEEAVLREMDEHEQQAVRELLKHANGHSTVTKQLYAFLDSIDPRPISAPNALTRAGKWLSATYERAWRARGSHALVRIFFIVQIIVLVGGVVSAILGNIDSIREFFRGEADYGHSLVIGQAIGTGLAAGCAIVGMVRLHWSRVEALEWFRWATLVNLLITEFFIFSRIQFGAMPGFIFNLVLLIAINFMLSYERRQGV